MKTLLAVALAMAVPCMAQQSGDVKTIPAITSNFVINGVPMDVAAVEEEYGNLGNYWCDMGECHWRDSDKPSSEGQVLHKRKRWTCADKRRVLLTSEDGIRHCILFPNQQSERAK